MMPAMRRHPLSVLLLASVLAAQTPPAPAADGVDFVTQVAPILHARCVECHGAAKQKGDLRLDQRATVFAAGQEDAWCVLPGKPDASELLRRICLPADDEDVMPPKGEPLTAPQQMLLRQWIAEGANWPEDGDAAIQKLAAALQLPKLTFELPAVDAAATHAIELAVATLRERGAVVQAVAADTAALDVNLSLLREQVTDADLTLLAPLAPVLVWLNLSRTAISDAGCKQIAALAQLRRLNVANTALGDDGFRVLRPLRQLEYLNAYGTQLSDDGLPWLFLLPRLDKLYVWDSKVTVDGARVVRDRLLRLQIDVGDYVEQRMAAAEQEIAEREAKSRPVNDVCPVIDKPADPAQFVDHAGERIAFCCPKCKAAFEKDPAKYLAKLKRRDPK